MSKILSLFRRFTSCRLGQHFNWKRHEPERGLAGAGECLDCGTKWEGIKWDDVNWGKMKWPPAPPNCKY